MPGAVQDGVGEESHLSGIEVRYVNAFGHHVAGQASRPFEHRDGERLRGRGEIGEGYDRVAAHDFKHPDPDGGGIRAEA